MLVPMLHDLIHALLLPPLSIAHLLLVFIGCLDVPSVLRASFHAASLLCLLCHKSCMLRSMLQVPFHGMFVPPVGIF